MRRPSLRRTEMNNGIPSVTFVLRLALRDAWGASLASSLSGRDATT